MRAGSASPAWVGVKPRSELVAAPAPATGSHAPVRAAPLPPSTGKAASGPRRYSGATSSICSRTSGSRTFPLAISSRLPAPVGPRYSEPMGAGAWLPTVIPPSSAVSRSVPGTRKNMTRRLAWSASDPSMVTWYRGSAPLRELARRTEASGSFR
jgi:hypothetical protein